MRDPGFQIRVRRGLRRLAQELLAERAPGSSFDWVEVGPELVGEAMSGWLVRYEDQPFSLVDAVSFELLR